jgi:hypothetical protein
MNQGQSAATVGKERMIWCACRETMRIFGRKFGSSGYPFWWLDANSGSGFNDKVGVPGSPLIFWHAARKFLPQGPLMPFFCDRDLDAAKALQQCFSQYPDAAAQSHLIPGDNDEAMEVFAEAIRRRENPKYAMGAMLLDPNGYWFKSKGGNGPPVRGLQWFTREFLAIDPILNLNLRFYWMARKLDWGLGLPPPRALLESLGKKHWLVGQSRAGNTRFILAIGRNILAWDDPTYGLYSWNHPIGREILAAAETDGQGDLGLERAVSELSAIPGPPSVPRRQGNRHAPSQPPLQMRRTGDRGASLQGLPALGDVRRTIQPAADLPRLPLRGAWHSGGEA